MTGKNTIIDFCISKSMNTMNIEPNDIFPWLVSLNFKDTKTLLELLDKEKILIRVIDVFKNWDYFPWKDFFYGKIELSNEYNDLLNEFISYYDNIENQELYFYIHISDKKINDELTEKLRIRFLPKVSIEEKIKRKNNWWEFID